MPQKPNKLDAYADDLKRMLLSKEFGGDGMTHAQAAAWLAERGVLTKTGKPLGPSAINDWWTPRKKDLLRLREVKTWVIEGRDQAESLATAPGFSPLMFLRAALVQIGALVMKVSENGNLDTETINAIKDLFQSLVAGVKEERGEQALKFDREKFAAAMRTKIEAGIEAIHAEIKGDAEAEALVARLKERVMKAAHEA